MFGSPVWADHVRGSQWGPAHGRGDAEFVEVTSADTADGLQRGVGSPKVEECVVRSRGREEAAVALRLRTDEKPRKGAIRDNGRLISRYVAIGAQGTAAR